ncbi:hypothetical protein K3495_g14035 [Podosphaera aphanis]|nr:hypothetical protein K3495_g14035 [Podosphaera aphanis]
MMDTWMIRTIFLIGTSDPLRAATRQRTILNIHINITSTNSVISEIERLNTTQLIHNEPVEATEEKQIVEFFDEQDFMGRLNKQNEIIEWKYDNQIRSST